MEQNNQKKSLRELVLEKIKTGQTQMRPRWHFVLKAGLLGVGLVIVLFLSLFLISFILFMLRENGVWLLPVFGFRGMGAFLFSLPWLLILLGLVFLVLLEILVRRYSFAYRKPLLYSLVGILIFVIGAGLVISKTSFHQGLFLKAREGRLPVAGPWYQNSGMMQNGPASLGTITEMTEEGFKIENRLGENLLIIVDSETIFPMGVDFQKGDKVLILGDRDDEKIKAIGVRRFDGEMMNPNHMIRRGWFRPSMMPPPF